jgi:hypothetical protein
MATNLCSTNDLQAGGIGTVNWGLNIRPHMSRAEAIEYLAANYPDPIDYGFWDDATFYCKERVARGGGDYYFVDAEEPGIDMNLFASQEDSPSVVKVLYKCRDVSPYPDGTVLAVYRPAAPTWDDASVVLDVWDEWADLSLTEGQAENIADQILSWIDDNQYTGTITVARPTVYKDLGSPMTAAYLRAGDYINESNLSAALVPPQMITSVNVDVDSGVVTLGIGESRAEFVSRIRPPSSGPRDHDSGHGTTHRNAGKPSAFLWK